MIARLGRRGALAVAVAVVLATPGWAFYPFGFYDETGALTIVKWPLSAFDTNGDGDVSGPGEGIPLNFEINGPNNDGFTPAEIAKILNGYEEWERVTTAYAAFRQGQSLVDPVEVTGDLDNIDAFNYVMFESVADATEQGGTLAGGSLSITLVAAALEDTFITIGNSTFPVTGGQILDVDTVIVEEARNLENTTQLITLQGLATFASGVGLGLNWSPLTNFDSEESEQQGVPVERRVINIRNFDGTLTPRGVTSSMVNSFALYTEDGNDSHQDLAPDDIAAITFMYPRTDQDLFFEIQQKARTRARQGFASQPIAGAWIRAWVDADNNPATVPVLFADTLTGLYQWQLNTDFRGHFELKGLFKQLETQQQTVFAAPFTITCGEFLPEILPDDRETYDSTHGAFVGAPTGVDGFGFDSLFPSEVFNENGNLLGIPNLGQGTPLIFDLNRRRIVSQTSGKTLDVILAAGRPMFGDQNSTCPLNVVVSGINVVQGPNVLRALRDKVLLPTAAGAAFVDLYYRAAPAMAAFLIETPAALTAARVTMTGFEWIVVHAEISLLAIALFLVSAVAWRRRRHVSTLALLALTFGIAPFSGQAMVDDRLGIDDYLTMADDVIVGKVISVESRWTDDHKKIVTDVAIEVSEAIKGNQNKGNHVNLRLPTGRVGAIVRYSPDLPTFQSGEEVLLFLDCQPRGHAVIAGVVGKFVVRRHPKTGEKYVFAQSLPGRARLERVAAKMNKPDETEAKAAENAVRWAPFEQRTLVKLEEFTAYLRGIDRKQRKLAQAEP
ncbi:MAG: hypothetical protein AMXMBFR4_19790 [Candidatus Hydrogenedentota bacterium]